MRMMSSSTIPFDHAEAQREGWDVFKCMPDAEGRPQYQLQHLDTPEHGEPVETLLRDRPLAMEVPAPALTALTNRLVAYLED